MSDDDLRAKLTEALLDLCYWRTSGTGGWARRQADAVLPVVREHLAQAWDDGFNAAGENVYGVSSDVPNPWREDT